MDTSFVFCFCFLFFFFFSFFFGQEQGLSFLLWRYMYQLILILNAFPLDRRLSIYESHLEWGNVSGTDLQQAVKRVNKAHSVITSGAQILKYVQQLHVILSVITLVRKCSMIYVVGLKYRQYCVVILHNMQYCCDYRNIFAVDVYDKWHCTIVYPTKVNNYVLLVQ